MLVPLLLCMLLQLLLLLLLRALSLRPTCLLQRLRRPLPFTFPCALLLALLSLSLPRLVPPTMACAVLLLLHGLRLSRPQRGPRRLVHVELGPLYLDGLVA